MKQPSRGRAFIVAALSLASLASLASTTSRAQTPTTRVLVPGADAEVQIVGAAEVDHRDGVRLRLSSAGVRFWLKGEARLVWASSLSSDVDDLAEEPGGNRYGVRRRTIDADGTSHIVDEDLPTPTTPIVAADWTELTVLKRTERLFGGDRLLAIVVDDAGPDAPPAPLPHRKTLVVLGDSWAAGFGVRGNLLLDDEGKPRGPRCPFTPDTQDVRQAWPTVLGDALDHDVAVVAWSGRGLQRDWQGDPRPETVPSLFAASLVAPDAVDAVIVALGHNDAAEDLPDEAAFRAAWRHTRVMLQDRFGPAPIIIVVPSFDDTPPAIDRHKALWAWFDGPIKRIVEPSMNAALGLGCVWHPGTRMQADIAQRLQADIVHALR